MLNSYSGWAAAATDGPGKTHGKRSGTALFLVPFSVFLLYIGWDYVAASWANHEASREAGGLPLVWLLKGLILVLPALLLLQSLSTIRNCLVALRSSDNAEAA